MMVMTLMGVMREEEEEDVLIPEFDDPGIGGIEDGRDPYPEWPPEEPVETEP